MICQNVGVALAEPVEQTCRPFDVREKEGDGASRELSHRPRNQHRRPNPLRLAALRHIAHPQDPCRRLDLVVCKTGIDPLSNPAIRGGGQAPSSHLGLGSGDMLEVCRGGCGNDKKGEQQ